MAGCLMLYLSSCAVASSTDRCTSLSDTSLMSASRKFPITCTVVLAASAQLRAGGQLWMMAARVLHMYIQQTPYPRPCSLASCVSDRPDISTLQSICSTGAEGIDARAFYSVGSLRAP